MRQCEAWGPAASICDVHTTRLFNQSILFIIKYSKIRHGRLRRENASKEASILSAESAKNFDGPSLFVDEAQKQTEPNVLHHEKKNKHTKPSLVSAEECSKEKEPVSLCSLDDHSVQPVMFFFCGWGQQRFDQPCDLRQEHCDRDLLFVLCHPDASFARLGRER